MRSYAEGVWIPEAEDSKNIDQFRTISLLSFEGKIFFSIVPKRLITWACMSFKSGKSRSLVLKKGLAIDKYRFALASTQIPFITEKPVKSLGKVLDCRLKDTASERPTNNWISC